MVSWADIHKTLDFNWGSRLFVAHFKDTQPGHFIYKRWAWVGQILEAILTYIQPYVPWYLLFPPAMCSWSISSHGCFLFSPCLFFSTLSTCDPSLVTEHPLTSSAQPQAWPFIDQWTWGVTFPQQSWGVWPYLRGQDLPFEYIETPDQPPTLPHLISELERWLVECLESWGCDSN